MNETLNKAHFGDEGNQVVVEGLLIADKEVVREARHWTSGVRGPGVDDPAELASADLTNFAAEAILLGARVLSATAQTTEVRALERMLKEVGDKTAEASFKAAEITQRATKEASEVVTKVANEAKTAIVEADEKTRKEFTSAVQTAKQELAAETRRLFGGDHPELLEKLQPVLEKFGSALQTQVRTGTNELLEKATKQLDPADPTSPMAKHAAALAVQQEQFAKQIEKSHCDLATKIDILSTAIKVQDAKASIAKVTPIKGGSFEDQIHALMGSIAAGLGDEYEDTTTKTGLLPRSKKGDGVLTVSGQPAKVVMEMTDSSRSGWGDYFDEAERNRGAAAGLGVVRSASQNGGQTIRVLGQRRVVMAFDPGADDPEVLRTVVMLLRTVAIAASIRTGDSEIATAEERIDEALKQLEKIDTIKKAADTIQKSASKIESECTAISTAIRRLLDQAIVALTGNTSSRPGGAAGSTDVSGAA
jgi:vacuolar-type H+-ATPase subunit E/Vma4